MAGYEDALDFDLNTRVPDQLRGLRACIPCMMIKTYTQFYDHGCENCPFLEMSEQIKEATTPHFDGMVAMMEPRESWVSKWQRIDKLVPGCYAVKVHGEVSAAVHDLLENENFRNLGKLSQEEN